MGGRPAAARLESRHETCHGAAARRTVAERYATPVVARQYLELLHRLLDTTAPESAAPINQQMSTAPTE